MEADKRQRMPVEKMSDLPCRNPLVIDDVHLAILKELDGLVEVRTFKERDTKISTLLQLWVALVTNPNKTNYIAEVFFTLFRKTTVAILSPDWMSITLVLKEKLINAIDIAGQTLNPAIEGSLHLCNALRRTAQEPWKNKTWKYILDGNLDIDDQNVQHCLAAEPEDLLLSRVQFLAQSGCERQAMSLAKCCFKFFNRLKKDPWSARTSNSVNIKERQNSKITHYSDFSSVEWFLFLLQKKDKIPDIIKETATLSCHEGVQLIKFLRRKSISDPLLKDLTNVFLVRDFMFPSQYCCTKDLIALWVSLHQKEKISDIADAVRKFLVPYASTSAHFYVCVDVLWEQFGSKLLSLYVEMYVRGLTADVNFLEVARSNEMRETVQELEVHISNVWHKLSTLFDDGSEEVARECMLSAFSMRPTKERLYILQSLTHSILSESQLQAYSSEEQNEDYSLFVESEKRRYRNCRCGSKCSDNDETCSAAAENNQSSASLHPLLRRGMKGISYSCVRDLVSLLECVQCKTFQFNCFDWYRRSSELGDYLKTHTGNANALFYANNEDMSFIKAQVGNPMFHHSGDDMDTESPSDEDIMDYESTASEKPCGNLPVVSSEGNSLHQSPLTVPFKQEQTSCSVWAHSKSEAVPSLKMNSLYTENMDFIPKVSANPPSHVCHSTKPSSFSSLVNSNIGVNLNITKEIHAKSSHANIVNSGVGKMHQPHAEHSHSTGSIPNPCGRNLTIAGATEAMLRSVILNNSPVSDSFVNNSTSFLTHRNKTHSANLPFTMTAASSMAVHSSHLSTVNSSKYSTFPHDTINSRVQTSDAPLIQTKQPFSLSSSNVSVHQPELLPSCAPGGSFKDVTKETIVSRSNISASTQTVSRTVSSVNNASSQNIARPNILSKDSMSSIVSSKMHGLHCSNYIQQESLPSSNLESLVLSEQNKNIGDAVSNKEIQGNMLLALLENRKVDLTTETQNNSILSPSNLTTNKLEDGIPKTKTAETRNFSHLPINTVLERMAKDLLLSENSDLKAKTSNMGEQNSVVKHTMHMNMPADGTEGQVCSKIPIPVSVNTIPITRMTVEQLSSHEEKTSIPAFKISMPPDMKKPFRNWFFPANLVIPKNSNTIGNDPLGESNLNSDCLLEGNAKPLENNAISIPGFIVFKSSKGKYFSSPPKVVKPVATESGNSCQPSAQKKIWTSYRSSFGEVACRKTSCSDVNIGTPVQKVHLKQTEKYSSASAQGGVQSIKNNAQRCFQSATGVSTGGCSYFVHEDNISNNEHELPQFFISGNKSDASLPAAATEPTVVSASKVSASKTDSSSCHQTSVVPSNIPHVISVQGKDIHPSFSICSERKIPPQNVSVSSSDKNLPQTDSQNSSNKLERLGSPSVSTEKMCCSENEVVPCQSCSLSAAQAHQNDQSLKAGLSQRRDAAGVKSSGTSNMVKSFKTFYN